MAEYHAWAATGLVAGFQAWSEADFASEADVDPNETGGVRIASNLVERQKFYLRQPGHPDIEVNLTGCTLPVRDGQAATAVWAARRGASHGFCVHLENHTTGAGTRLAHNVPNIRAKVSLARTAKFGAIATIPAGIALMLWLLIPGSTDEIDMNIVVLSAVAALSVLFAIGFTIAKVVLDYLQADDDQKIWQAVDDVLGQIHAALRQPTRVRARHR
jgi:hypothetical protein